VRLVQVIAAFREISGADQLACRVVSHIQVFCAQVSVGSDQPDAATGIRQ
jgi:hypothetical protein